MAIQDSAANARRAFFVCFAMLAYAVGIAPHALEWSQTGMPPAAFEWNLSHYHANYADFGLLRRGLIATLIAPVLSLFPDGGIGEYVVLLGIDVAIALGLALIAARVLFPSKEWPLPGQTLMAIALIFSPAGFMQFGFDAGRLDHINFLLIIFALWAIKTLQIALAGLVAGLCVLVHEAALFFALPLIAAYAGRSGGMQALLAVSTPALIATGCLYFLGWEGSDMETRLPAEANLAWSVWTRDLFEPARGWPITHYIIAAYFAVVPLFLLWRHYKFNDLKPDLIFFAPFIALSLYVLGVDYGRWGGCLLFLTIAILGLAPDLDRRRGLDLDHVWTRGVILPWLIPAGPIGVAVLYPLIPFIV